LKQTLTTLIAENALIEYQFDDRFKGRIDGFEIGESEIGKRYWEDGFFAAWYEQDVQMPPKMLNEGECVLNCAYKRESAEGLYTESDRKPL